MKHLMNADGKLRSTAYTLVVIGVINFILGDFFGFNPIDEAFGQESAIATFIYMILGLAVLYVFYDLAASLRKTR